MDDVIADFFAYMEDRHAETARERRIPALAERLGYRVRSHAVSRFDPTKGTVYVRADAGPRAARAEGAHEVTHALMGERDEPDAPSYEDVIRHYHASVPDMHAHIENLTDHGSDRLTMPTDMVSYVIQGYGLTAEAVYVLHRLGDVRIREALRRLVYADPFSARGGFFSQYGIIMEAASYRYRLPFWKNERVPEPDILLEHGVSLFTVPGRRRHIIGLVIAD